MNKKENKIFTVRVTKEKLILLVVLVIASILVSIVPSQAATKTFKDVKNSDWCYETVKKLTDMGIIDGYADSTFKPIAKIQTDAFIKLVVTTKGYRDLPASSDYWAQTYIDKAISLGYVKADEFDYTKDITREQMAVIISRALETELSKPEASSFNMSDGDKYFKDWSDATYKKELATCLSLGIMTGYEDNTIKPMATATRAEAASLVARLLDLKLRVNFVRP